MSKDTLSPVRVYEVPEETKPPRPTFPESEVVIHTHNLTKKFGEETAVDGVNLDIPQGKIFGFIGPSGCGKTTTVRLLLGIYQPTEGAITVFGRAPSHFRREDREKIGYMPQLFVLYPALTVWENLNFAASLYGVPWRRHKRLKQLLDLVELQGHEGKVVRDISGGMQRRLSLAAALVHQPQLLFLDEPTAGIDPVLRRKFWDYFKELQAEGKTLFVTTQYVNEAAYCDYVGVMAEGRLLMVETPEDLRRRASGGDVIELKLEQPLDLEKLKELRSEPYVRDVTRMENGSYRVVVRDASVAIPRLVTWSEKHDLEAESIHQYLPPFDDVFVNLVEEEVTANGK